MCARCVRQRELNMRLTTHTRRDTFTHTRHAYRQKKTRFQFLCVCLFSCCRNSFVGKNVFLNRFFFFRINKKLFSSGPRKNNDNKTNNDSKQRKKKQKLIRSNKMSSLSTHTNLAGTREKNKRWTNNSIVEKTHERGENTPKKEHTFSCIYVQQGDTNKKRKHDETRFSPVMTFRYREKETKKTTNTFFFLR